MAKANVHATAIIESGARLGDGVRIGPFCSVGKDVTLGDQVELVSHAVVAGRTTVGARTRIFPFASIGHQPQDLKYNGEPSTLQVGSDCLIREGVTMNPGTPVESIEHVIDLVDLVLVMSVNPGWGGQKFIPAAEEKIRRVAALVGGRPIDIEIDGGVTPENTELVTRAGANALVAGSAVFKGGGGVDGYGARIAAIRQAAAFARGEAA